MKCPKCGYVFEVDPPKPICSLQVPPYFCDRPAFYGYENHRGVLCREHGDEILANAKYPPRLIRLSDGQPVRRGD